jgi:queuine tRNA-ribosyltransferase
MFDCVLPTRLARHGSVYVKDGTTDSTDNRRQKDGSANNKTMQQYNNYVLLNLTNSKYRDDPGVIQPGCKCDACKNNFSRAYISHLLRSKEILGLRLATLHNLFTYLDLMRSLRIET